MRNIILILLLFQFSYTFSQSDDVDGDGVVNAVDNCPYTANVDQADGDSDGIGDVCDCAPMVSGPLVRVHDAVRVVQNPSGAILQGQSVRFTVADTFTAATRKYQWVKNELWVGGDSAVYIDHSLQNNDSVYCILWASNGCSDTRFDHSNHLQLSVTAPNGILSANSVIPFSLNPNPTNGLLRITLPLVSKATILIADLQEKSVLHFETTSEVIEVSTSELPSGMYWVTIQTTAGVARKKLLKN